MRKMKLISLYLREN